MFGLFKNRQKDIINFHLSQSGIDFETRGGDKHKGFLWSQVSKIETYKIDLITYDEVALAFTTDIGVFQILEGHSAFVELTHKLSTYFDTVDPSWYFEVMQNAFETNHKVLFEQ